VIVNPNTVKSTRYAYYGDLLVKLWPEIDRKSKFLEHISDFTIFP